MPLNHAALAIMLFLDVAVAADEFCAVELSVIDRYGRIQDAPFPVVLKDSHGTVVARTTLQKGTARFCDFGFGPHSILIGRPESCGSTEIRNITFKWRNPQHFVSVLNFCIGEGDGGLTGCPIELRVTDQEGRPVPFPTAKNNGRNVRGQETGFLATALSPGQSTELVVEAGGYTERRLSFRCDKVQIFQETVVLERPRRLR
jgi:hypothetical protein